MEGLIFSLFYFSVLVIITLFQPINPLGSQFADLLGIVLELDHKQFLLIIFQEIGDFLGEVDAPKSVFGDENNYSQTDFLLVVGTHHVVNSVDLFNHDFESVLPYLIFCQLSCTVKYHHDHFGILAYEKK